MSSERTERATPRRRQEARRRGQVPRSTELSAAAGLLGSVVFLRWYGGYAVNTLAGAMRGSFGNLGGDDITPLTVQRLGWDAGMVFLRVAGPLIGVGLVVGVLATVAQSGLVLAPAALKPDFSRVNPAQGFQRIFSRRGAFEAGKALLKLVIVGGLTYPAIQRAIEQFAGMTGGDLGSIARTMTATLGQIALRAGGAYFVLALADYAYQRWDYERRLRMTRQELREELKLSEGNPELKSRLRRLQRQMARGRMMTAVPKATVVLANPTHLAVAIRYEMDMAAPVVLAKGSGWMAERIKEVARAHAIPVVENKPLAQTLFRMTDIGMEIPMALYEAVADVIAYVYRLRTRRTY